MDTVSTCQTPPRPLSDLYTVKLKTQSPGLSMQHFRCQNDGLSPLSHLQSSSKTPIFRRTLRNGKECVKACKGNRVLQSSTLVDTRPRLSKYPMRNLRRIPGWLIEWLVGRFSFQDNWLILPQDRREGGQEFTKKKKVTNCPCCTIVAHDHKRPTGFVCWVKFRTALRK